MVAIFHCNPLFLVLFAWKFHTLFRTMPADSIISFFYFALNISTVRRVRPSQTVRYMV
jgi:hypothetical protein